MKYNFDEYQSFLLFDRRMTKKIFLERVGVNDETYACDMFSRMYDSIMSEAKDVENEFSEFYQIEYKDLRGYLLLKYSLPNDIVDEIFMLKSKNGYLTLHSKDDLACGHYSLYELAFTEELYERIMDVLYLKNYED